MVSTLYHLLWLCYDNFLLTLFTYTSVSIIVW